GFGMYSVFNGAFGSQTGFFIDTPYIANDLGGKVGVPELGVNTFANPFPRGAAAAPRPSAGLSTQLGQGLSFDEPNGKVPTFTVWNLGFQRQVTPNLIVEAAYVGSRTTDLGVSHGINSISASDLAKGATVLQQTVTNPFAGLLPGSSINGRTVQRQQLLRPFPEFQGITENSIPIGKTWYHSLQVRIEKRTSYGLSFISSYTLSKSLQQSNFLNDQDTVMVRELTDYDRTHRWVFSGIYDLPFGRGRHFMRESRGLFNQLLGGWQVNWIFTYQSGVPLGERNLERLASAKLASPTADRYFNTCYRDVNGNQQGCLTGETPVWFQRAPFTLRTTPDRLSDIRAPWTPVLDASFFKVFTLTERFKLQYRFETFNTLNSVIFPAPVTDFTSSNFGKIPQPRGSIYFPRNIQMTMKLYF